MKNKRGKEILDILEGLETTDEQERNEKVCELLGHSKIQYLNYGVFTCGRCGEELGKVEIGKTSEGYDNTGVVVVGCNCETCEGLYEELGWEDKLFCCNPFDDDIRPRSNVE